MGGDEEKAPAMSTLVVVKRKRLRTGKLSERWTEY